MSISETNVNVSFELCAAHFLLQWKRKEENFYKSFSKKPSAEALRSALSFFIIARNFKGIKKNSKIAQEIIDMLLEADNEIDLSVQEKVSMLATKFKDKFEKNNISAASKLLWLRNRAPFIIYDSRAEKTLKALGAKFRSRDYEKYCIVWRDKYEYYKPAIVRAVSGLHNIKTILPDWDQTVEDTKAMVHSEWFLERVFDIYLYQNSEGV